MEFIRDEKRDKKIHYVIVLLTIGMIFFGMCSEPATAQIYKAKDLPKLLELSKTDPDMKLERMAALEFHKLVNEYRKSKGIKPLLWNDTIWITARNHCVWMQYNKLTLRHTQFAIELYHTGDEPTDRATFVCDDKKLFELGENCAWFGAFGETIEEKAKSAAKTAFKMLKDDAPHNQNMLDEGYKEQGVAFYLNGSYVCEDLVYYRSFQ